MNYGRAYSPPCEGGVSAPSKNGSVPKTARTGWSLTSYVSKCVLKHWLVSDHFSVDGCATFYGCRSHSSYARRGMRSLNRSAYASSSKGVLQGKLHDPRRKRVAD